MAVSPIHYRKFCKLKLSSMTRRRIKARSSRSTGAADRNRKQPLTSPIDI